MDEPLRVALWNVLYVRYWETYEKFFHAHGQEVARILWATHLRRDMSTAPDSALAAGKAFRSIVMDGEWHEVYDFLEAVVQTNPEDDMIELLNAMLDENLAGYRIVDDEITPLTDSEEITEVEAALDAVEGLAGARHSLRNALTLFSRRDAPDYANSIKESISAVEAVARDLTGKRTLGAALDQIQRDHPGMHQALITGWKALYGYASDAPSIRHGGASAPEANQDLARYFLIISSAFVNYLSSLRQV